jgi:hypothetical protein
LRTKIRIILISALLVLTIICTSLSTDIVRLPILRISVSVKELVNLSCPHICLLVLFLTSIIALFIESDAIANVLRYTFYFLGSFSSLALLLMIYIVIKEKALYPADNHIFDLILVERASWLILGVIVIILGPISGIIKLSKFIMPERFTLRFFRLTAPEGRTIESKKDDVLLFVLSMLFSAFTIFIPHATYFNPRHVAISVDTKYNTYWVETLLANGLLRGLHELSRTLRPLYLIFIYSLYKALPFIPPTTFSDIILPSLGLLILVIETFILYGGWASMLIPLYLGPMFLYGGFQTNLYALSMLYLAFFMVKREEEKPMKMFSWCLPLLLIIIGLWHPWTLMYFTVVYLVYVLLSIKRNTSLKKDAIVVLSILISWALTLFINYILGGFSATPGIVRPGTTLGPSPLFTLYVYVWGTLARPEVLLPIILLLPFISEEELHEVSVALSLISLVVLSYCGAFRVMLEAPVPILLGYMIEKGIIFKRKEELVLFVLTSITAWLYLVLSSVPLATP